MYTSDIYKKTMNVLIGGIYQEYMTEFEKMPSYKTEEEIRHSLYLIGNFPSFAKLYFKDEKTCDKMLAKSEQMRKVLVSNLFNALDEDCQRKQYQKRQRH